MSAAAPAPVSQSGRTSRLRARIALMRSNSRCVTCSATISGPAEPPSKRASTSPVGLYSMLSAPSSSSAICTTGARSTAAATEGASTEMLPGMSRRSAAKSQRAYMARAEAFRRASRLMSSSASMSSEAVSAQMRNHFIALPPPGPRPPCAEAWRRARQSPRAGAPASS